VVLAYLTEPGSVKAILDQANEPIPEVDRAFPTFRAPMDDSTGRTASRHSEMADR
jgi:hypothetical protein